MTGPTPTKVGLALLAASVSLLPLHALGAGEGLQHTLPVLEGLRLLVALPVVLFVPGYFVVLRWGSRDLSPRRPGALAGEGESLDPAWTAIFAFGVTILVHVVHFNLLRLIGLPIGWLSLGGLAVLESSVGYRWLRRHPPRPWATLPPPDALALAVPPLVIALFALWQLPHLVRDSSWYFHSDSLQTDWEASIDPGALSSFWGNGTAVEEGSLYVPQGQSASLRFRNDAEEDQNVPIFVLVHGPIGTRTELADGVNVFHGETIAQAVQVEWSPDPVERYWDAGTTASFAMVGVPGKGEAEVQIRILPPNQSGATREPCAIRAWINLSSGEVVESTANRGIHAMHPFQLLNVTENVRWAHEVSTSFVLAGRSLDGQSTLHQPPIWTYVYAPARLLGTHQLASASLLLLAIMVFIPWTVLSGIRDEGGQLGPALASVVALGAVQHGRLMVNDGSMNFPDSLFALGIVAAVVALCSARARIFALWALLAALLRYPGAVVVAMAGCCLLGVDRTIRLRAIDALMRFSLAIGVFCAGMLATGLVTGALDSWLFTLYFETIPEHFLNAGEGADALWRRPLVFGAMWAGVGGAVVLLAPPLRGRLSKVALGTALLYFPCLAFIHHYSHHYFLPLIALATAAAAGSLAQVEDAKLRRQLSYGALGLSLALCFLAWRLPI